MFGPKTAVVSGCISIVLQQTQLTALAPGFYWQN
jgi:hypothetical protein